MKNKISVDSPKDATVRVEKIENGYLLTKEWYEPAKKDGCGKYICKKYYYEADPLATIPDTAIKIKR